jgi:long-subunit acyl-CoA synthetase (AMP-forming)
VLNDSGAGLIMIEDGYAGELMAYMYTSGTTEVSKGVLISHAHAYTYPSSASSVRRPGSGRPSSTRPTGGWTRLAWCVSQP